MLLLPLLMSAFSFASFPKNNLHEQDFVNGFTASISALEFRQTIDAVVNFYRPIIAARGANLTVEYNWEDSTVNAFADKQGNEWTIAMYGGMARRPEITRDGFQMVVCHEMGHLLGGFPFYSNEDLAAEGQADFWATQACVKRVWKGGGPAIKARAIAASRSISNMLATLEGNAYPSPDRKDPSVVLYTQDTHPVAQCRLDTYLAGVACNQVFPTDAYPKTQFQAYSVSCMPPQKAQRPRCWFAPK
jgi:hypothetical protein